MLRITIAILMVAIVVTAGKGKGKHRNKNKKDGTDRETITLPFELTNPTEVNGNNLYQSDILLTDKQKEALKKRKAIADEDYRWPVGDDDFPLVPYVFQDDVDQDDIGDALDHWMEHTCINFKETSNTAQPHLQFHVGSGCWSYIGMIYVWDGQQISIGSGCNDLGTIAHEVGHAIGFFHEQSRSDRDAYVEIQSGNIQSGYEGQFDTGTDNNYSVTYDYTSNMHYGLTYFSSNNLPTIVTLDPWAMDLIGSRNGLTHRDMLLANRMYSCIDKWLAACSLSEDPCLNDGYTGEDCVCICSPGYSGTTCETEENGGDYYALVHNALSEEITTERSISVITPLAGGSNVVKIITPPSNKKAIVTFTSSDMYASCYYQSLNVRTNSSNLSGELWCYDDVIADAKIESEEQIVITMINMVPYSSTNTLWEADVTFEDIDGATTIEPTTEPPVTEPPTEVLACEDRPKRTVLTSGTTVTITSPDYPSAYSSDKIKCGWKLKAPRKGSLTMTCDSFDIHQRDLLKIGRSTFGGSTGPSEITSRGLAIKFKSKRRKSGDGFSCTVVSN